MADQGAGRNSGQAAGSRFVQFSRGAAQRIANVVRIVEAGDRNQPPLRFEHPVAHPVPLRLATFTGDWAIGEYKTVTIAGGTATAEVVNYCNPAVAGTSTAQTVIFGRVHGTNSVLELPHPELKPLRVATFTGAWATGTYKTVTLVGSTATADVYNWCNPSLMDTSNERYVVFGAADGTNTVVEIAMDDTSATCRMTIGTLDATTLTGYDATAIQVLGHNTTGPCLQWYSVTTCSTT